MGLWTLCNSWSRDNRTAGFIPAERVTEHHDEVAALLQSGLWAKVETPKHGYQFKDWAEWNADESPRTTAGLLVHKIIPPGHPGDVIQKLTKEVSDLLIEGIEFDVVKAALKLWLGKSNAAPSWLPMLVSDVVRRGGYAERDAALREAWKTGDTKVLARFGLVFTAPDLPLSIVTVNEAKAFMLNAKQQWIEQVRKEQ